MADSPRVEIGYLEKSEQWKLESRFFPSKVGGKPAWLDLKNISVDVACGICSNPCIFLCQLYAPSEQDRGYHRTIYIFICRNPECCRANQNKNFKVFRCQLPRENSFYVSEEPTERPDWHTESSACRFNSLCAICGCLGFYQCGQCKIINYCSKQHQILDWEFGHNMNCGINHLKSVWSGILFPEYEIIIELEEMDDVDENDDAKKADNEEENSEEKQLREYEYLVKEGKAGTMQNVPSFMIDELVSGKEDKYFKNFKERLKLCPDQVVRYDKGGQPLWFTKPNLDPIDVPNCDYCKEGRKFEFQVLPTMLRYLNVDSLEKSIDWGTLLVYTCKNNCTEGPSYKREFLWKQDIL